MKITVHYGDIHQAATYNTLPEHMAKFARDAEAGDAGGTHELDIQGSPAWPLQSEAFKSAAVQHFFEAIEKIRN